MPKLKFKDTIWVTIIRKLMARFTLTIPELVNSDLQRWADTEGRTKAGLASYLVEAAVRDRYPENYPPPDVYKKGLQGTMQPPPDAASIPPRELELIRKWIAGDVLKNEDLGIVATLLGVEPEELVRKQRIFTLKKESANT